MSSTVSIIIPAYNQSQYLAAAIKSALAQTYRAIEVLVVDDGSTDDTRQVAASFTDPRVRYIYQDNRGLAAARNTGLRHATGGFVSFLDSDDLFLPEKLALLVAALDEQPALGLVAGEAVLIDEHGEPLGEVFERPIPAEPSDLLLGNPLHVGAVVVRREWQERAGFFDESLRSYEDWDMWLRLARAGCRMGWVARRVSLYRFHRAQMTRIGTQMTTATFAVLKKTFDDPDLPKAWRLRRDEAYSRAHLRAAAQAYTGRDFPAAAGHMRDAVRANPSLAGGGAEPVARIIAGWANYVKTPDPLGFLQGVYDHLPEELAPLRARRRRDLAAEALHLAAAAWRRQDARAMRSLAWQALCYRPVLAFDRSAIAMLLGGVDGRPGSGVPGGALFEQRAAAPGGGK